MVLSLDTPVFATVLMMCMKNASNWLKIGAFSCNSSANKKKHAHTFKISSVLPF